MNFARILATIFLVSGLVFLPLEPYHAVYVALATAVIVIAFYWRVVPQIVRQKPFIVMALAFALLIFSLPFHWQGAGDLYFLAAIVPVPLVALGAAVLLHHQPVFARAEVIGALCLTGAAIAALIGINDVYHLGIDRAGGGNNPLHFSAIAVLLGFSALIGFVGSNHPARVIFLTGPAFAMIAAFLSASRGPMLAGAIIMLVLVPLFVRWFWRSRYFWFSALVPAGLVVIAWPFAPLGVQDRILTSVDMISNALQSALSGGAIDAGLDFSSTERTEMFSAAWGLFLQQPIAGYGSSAFAAFFGDAFPGHLEHLHSDVADFAIVAGMLGVLAYVCLLVMPWMSSKHASWSRPRLVLAIVVTLGTFVLGLTNAVLGILPQTVLVGILLGYAAVLSEAAPSKVSE